MVNQQVIDVIFPVFSDHKHGFFGYVERDWTNLETVLTFVYTVIRRVSLYSKSSGFMPPMHVNSKEKIAQMWVSREQNLGPVWPGRSRSKMKIEIFTWSAWPVTRKLQIFQSIPLARQLLFYSAFASMYCSEEQWQCMPTKALSLRCSKCCEHAFFQERSRVRSEMYICVYIHPRLKIFDLVQWAGWLRIGRTIFRPALI